MRERMDAMLNGVSCPVCSKWFKSRANLIVHAAIHEDDSGKKRTHRRTGESRGGKQIEEDMGLKKISPAVCPTCNQQFSTTTTLNRHYLRKHVEGVTFLCPKCGTHKKSKADLRTHVPFCLRGPDAGKIIRCTACQFMVENAHSWQQHSKLTNHRNYELCWPDGSSGTGPKPAGLSAMPSAFGTVLHDDEVVLASGAPDDEPASEDEAVVVHVGQLEVLHDCLKPGTIQPAPQGSEAKVPRLT